MPKRAPAPQQRQYLHQWHRRGIVLALLVQPSDWFGNGKAHEYRQQDAGRAHYQEGHPPAKELIEPAACKKAEQNTDTHTHRVKADRAGPLPGSENIRDNRVRRRAATGLPYPDTDAGQQQLGKILHETADCGHEAPQEQRKSHDIAPVGAVGPACDRYPGCHIEGGEGEARQQTQLPV